MSYQIGGFGAGNTIATVDENGRFRTRSVPPGTWVTWSNGGTDAHTVTAMDGSFDSGELAPSEGFSWLFDQPGRYQYMCVLHPWMTGTIIVGDGAALPTDPVDPGADSTP